MGSVTARKLAKELGVRRVFPDGKYKNYPNHVVINWGSSRVPVWNYNANYLNPPDKVGRATDKRSALITFQESGVPCPEYALNKQDAVKWFQEDPKTVVVCRRLFNSCAGKGIVLANSAEELITAPLYTKYIPKKKEYRVHLLPDGEVLLSQKKKRNGWKEDPTYNPKIRSHLNGWIFAQPDNPDDRCIAVAEQALVALELHFGAVDVIYNEKRDQYYVLEVNSAPGLEGRTLEAYVKSFKSYLEALQ